MKRRTYLPLVAAGTLLAGACSDITIPDYKNQPIDALTTNPTVESVKSAATGVLQGTRNDADTYVLWGGIVGREGYFLDPNESRYVRQLFAGSPLASNFTGSSYWTTPYRNIRTAHLLIAALENPNVTMSPAEEAGIRGVVKTIQALDFLQLLNTRERIAIDVNQPLDQLTTPAPLVDRAAALAHVVKLLDEGRTDLQAAGSSFAFPLPSGITQFGFGTPAEFARFNRGLLARVEVLRATSANSGAFDATRYTAALTALGQSFVSTAGTAEPLTERTALNRGVYQTYSGNAGDTENSLYDPSGKTVADSTLRRDAQRNGAQVDARLAVKTENADLSIAVRGLTSNLRFTLYSTKPFYGAGGQASPIPMVRNEELVLLRSEARWFTGDKPGAMADLNWVRRNSGGLSDLAQPATDAEFVTALLRERRYSLMMEGAHRWIDYRRFGRIAQLSKPENGTQRVGGSADTAVPYLPVPSNECLARPSGC